MLTERQIRNKLYEYADQFRGAYLRKEWARAKSLYFTAQRIAVFLELPELGSGRVEVQLEEVNG